MGILTYLPENVKSPEQNASLKTPINANKKQKTNKPYLVNKSKKTIFYKSENGNDKIPLKPGDTTYAEVDGIRVGDTKIKVTDGYGSITVKNDGTVEIIYKNVGDSIIYDLLGGKMISPPDDHWSELFN